MVRVLANDPGDMGSIPGRVIPKTQKMVLDASSLNAQYYKVRFLGKVYYPPLHLDVVAIEKGAFESPSTTITNFYFTYKKKPGHKYFCTYKTNWIDLCLTSFRRSGYHDQADSLNVIIKTPSVVL